jgi:hypothetical protein
MAGYMKKFFEHYTWNHFYGILTVIGFTETKYGNTISSLLSNVTTNDFVQYLLLFTAIFFFTRDWRLRIFNEKRNKENYKDSYLEFLREFAVKLIQSDYAVFTLDGIRHDTAVPHTGSWEEWIKAINRDENVNFSDYGNKYQLIDLITQKTLKIPTGVNTNKIIGFDYIKKGMVVMTIGNA